MIAPITAAIAASTTASVVASSNYRHMTNDSASVTMIILGVIFSMVFIPIGINMLQDSRDWLDTWIGIVFIIFGIGGIIMAISGIIYFVK